MAAGGRTLRHEILKSDRAEQALALAVAVGASHWLRPRVFNQPDRRSFRRGCGSIFQRPVSIFLRLIAGQYCFADGVPLRNLK